MEDKEFCSECLLSTRKGQVIGSNQEILDKLYEEHQSDDFAQTVRLCRMICADLDSLVLDYQGRRIGGVSHLYGLWSLALMLRTHGRAVVDHKAPLDDFFTRLRESDHDEIRDDYRKSMTSRTKERFMRVKRVNALLAACGESALAVD